MEELVRFENLSKWNRNKQQFTDITFSVNAGEFTGVISDNLRVQYLLCEILCGREQPTAGSVFIDEKRLPKEDAASELSRMVFQMDGVEQYRSDLTVMDLFLTSAWSENTAIIRTKRMAAKIADAYEKYGIRMPDLRMKASDLTVLQRCQAVLLRETLCGTRIFLLIDISEFLNRSDIGQFLDTAREFQRRGAAFLMIDHDRNLMLANAQRFFVIRNGMTAFIAHGANDACLQSIFSDSGIEDHSHRTGRCTTDGAVLDVRALQAGDSVIRPFQIGRGEIAGLLDQSSYKGEILLGALCGGVSGDMYLNGRLFHPKNLHDAIRRGVGFVLETPALEDNMLNAEMSVSDNLLLTMAEKPLHMTLGRYRKVIRKSCVEFFGRDLSDQKVDDLDLLDRQKLIYFRWILYNPSLLVCSHPFSGSNLYMKRTTEDMIIRCARRGITVLIISNRASEVYAVCSKTIFL